MPVVTFLAKTLVQRAMLNPTIGHIWNHKTQSEVQEEITSFVEFLGDHWGGPHTYTGRDMATAHRGMGVTEEYWTALFDEIVTPAYAEFGLLEREAKEIDEFLRSFKDVVVGSPAFRTSSSRTPRWTCWPAWRAWVCTGLLPAPRADEAPGAPHG